MELKFLIIGSIKIQFLADFNFCVRVLGCTEIEDSCEIHSWYFYTAFQSCHVWRGTYLVYCFLFIFSVNVLFHQIIFFLDCFVSSNVSGE